MLLFKGADWTCWRQMRQHFHSAPLGKNIKTNSNPTARQGSKSSRIFQSFHNDRGWNCPHSIGSSITQWRYSSAYRNFVEWELEVSLVPIPPDRPRVQVAVGQPAGRTAQMQAVVRGRRLVHHTGSPVVVPAPIDHRMMVGRVEVHAGRQMVQAGRPMVQAGLPAGHNRADCWVVLVCVHRTLVQEWAEL